MHRASAVLCSRLTASTRGREGEENSRAVASMSGGGGGGSGAASPEFPSGDGGSGDWRHIYDRVEALAADLNALNRTQRENLHARLLQAEASRRRWKTAYIELPLLANPKIIELQEKDLEDSRNCQALFDVDNSGPEMQLKRARRHVDHSENDVDYEDIARDLRAELANLRQAYETLSTNKDKEAIEAAQKFQQNVEELQVAARKKDDEIGRLRAEAADAKNKERRQKRRMDTNGMSLMQHTMLISVKIRARKKITLEVMDSDTIYCVKARIQDKEGIPSGQQRLVFGDKLLVGSCTLKDHNIQHGSTLTLHFALQGMHIFFMTLTHQRRTLEVERTETVGSVKVKIFYETGVPPAEHRVIFFGNQLEEDRTLADYGIQNESTIHLLPPSGCNRKIHISVRTAAGRTIIGYYAFESEKVCSIKAKIHDALGFPPDQQCLFLRGEPLEDGRTLALDGNERYYCSCILVLQLRLPGD